MSLHSAAWDMLHAVEAADANGDLPDNIGGELIDALRAELDKSPAAPAETGEPNTFDRGKRPWTLAQWLQWANDNGATLTMNQMLDDWKASHPAPAAIPEGQRAWRDLTPAERKEWNDGVMEPEAGRHTFQSFDHAYRLIVGREMPRTQQGDAALRGEGK